MTDWWSDRNPREKRLLGAGVLAVALMLAWALAWQPLANKQRALEARISALNRSMAELADAEELKTRVSGNAMTPAGSTSDASLSIVVDRGMRMAGLAAAIRRIEPAGDNDISVSLERAPFDNLVGWIRSASREEGVRVTEANIDRADEEGTVNARLRLERGN